MLWTFNSKLPIYTQLISQLKLHIVRGTFSLGEKLPSVRDLAAAAGINPNTVQKALTELEREGFVFSQRTAGRFVTEDRELITRAKRELAQEQVELFLATMGHLGYEREEILQLLQEKEREESLCLPSLNAEDSVSTTVIALPSAE